MSLSDPVLALEIVLASTVLFGVTRKILSIGQREPLLPPGPPTKPILGNLDVLPTKDMYLKFSEWAKQYGNIFSLKVGSSTIIVLSDFDAVYQIMEKNGSITANRPVRAQAARIFGDQGSLSVVQYGPSFRTWRRAASDMLSPLACERHMPILHSEVNQLMNELLQHPHSFMDDIKRSVLSLSFSIIFGVRTPSITSPEAQSFLRASKDFFKLSAPGEVPPVHLIPLLYYVPDRFVRNWKARCDAVKKEQEGLWYRLLDDAEERLKNGTPNGCMAETLINRAEEWNLDRRIMTCMAGNFLIGAAHTTTSALHWFVLLVTIHQGSQAKLREEIDRVVGPDRAPTDKDIPNLPYLRAFIREVLRFRPVVPLALPHVANEDQLYQGYLIPKGATIFFNVWAILRDPTIFEDPDVFNPDRFMKVDPDKADIWKKLESLPFGAGRRICPGMYLANRVLELTAASLVWGFEFTPPPEGGLDEKNFTVSSTCEPLPFKCGIKPRSSGKAKIVKDGRPSSEAVFEKFEKQS